MPSGTGDPSWEFWGFVGGSILTVLIFYWQRRPKRINFTIIISEQLISSELGQGLRLRIMFGDQAVTSPTLVVAEISNSGKVEILPGDYQRPMVLSFGEGATAFSAEVVRRKPENLDCSVAIDQGRILISPGLMNETDSFAIRMLVTGSSLEPSLDARIAGATIRTKSPVPVPLVLNVMALSALGIFALLQLGWVRIPGYTLSFGFVGMFFFTIVARMVGTVLVQRRKKEIERSKRL